MEGHKYKTVGVNKQSTSGEKRTANLTLHCAQNILKERSIYLSTQSDAN